jgi:Zn-dependent protease with chaperone function
MYGHFIYFILVLLIYTTYYPPESPYIGPLKTLIIFSILLALFVATTRLAYRTLVRKMNVNGPYGLHGKFDRLFHRQAIMAVVIFSIDIYLLNLKLLIMRIPFFPPSPTLTALVFIGLFVAYLAIIWSTAYDAYKGLFQAGMSRRSYVLSNVSFNLPVILPWLAISAGMDIIHLLPFQLPKHLVATPEGQVVFFSCFLAALIVVAPSLIKFFWRCRPLPPGHQRRRIEAMCNKARMGYKNILRWPIFEGRVLTAGVMGLVKRFRYILVTEGLLQILSDDEIDAVMAHEIGHIKKKHLVFYLVFFLGFIVLSYAIFDLILYAVLYSNLSLPLVSDPKAEPLPFTPILFTLAMAATLLVYFRYVFGYFMRNCERQADLYAFTLLGHSSGLVSSLQKIAAYSGQSDNRPNWTHFSIRQRIDFLKKCEADGRWIARHDRKLQKSILVFIAGLLSMGYLAYAVNFGEIGRTLNTHFVEKVLAREIRRHPTNPALYTLMGSIYYQKQDYGQAIEAYEKAIELAPHDAEAFNNLAWLYATCEQARFRNPTMALVYAKQAAALKPDAHILDTLAESYYVNGLYAQATVVGRRALAMGPKDRAYYEDQLKKFEQAAAKQSKARGLGD